MLEQILENISVFQMNGSGWTFHSIVSLEILMVKYKPLRGGTYIPLPKFLTGKKALINMKLEVRSGGMRMCNALTYALQGR